MLSVIRESIKNAPGGSISYAAFMEMALYHPEHGYYQMNKAKIGRNGDFYTSSTTSAVYGAVWADVFYSMFSELGISCVLCEIGAGDGSFAKSVLDEWKRKGYPPLHYVVVESSPYHAEQIGMKLEGFCWSRFSSLEEFQSVCPSFNGIVFGNELLDALPVHVVRQTPAVLKEVRVALNETGELMEVAVHADDELRKWVETYQGDLEPGQTMEVPLAMASWLSKLYEWIERGFVVFVDYGYIREEWRQPEVREGSLRGYYRHQLILNPLSRPGEMDLTSHVHWDCVRKAGENFGCPTTCFQSQQEFLLEKGILNHLVANVSRDPFSPEHKKNRAIRSLIMDNSISRYFQILIQKKDGCC
ncbi:class I SAM-dependent methyltransferase [Fictibacillus fluitans]|uniref:SAM-dependent methyltransferase n=1 Tax=Fictibacillus fluitans TaxID=3058422 RepID=A0ABT8HX82_9BACL|nr:SAM-dependent methyltransferase [Fictibacillus sp. NE201]MDN4525369.1 SAM-dependent methyltransferase [Fictibacillus sp. NE201]